MKPAAVRHIPEKMMFNTNMIINCILNHLDSFISKEGDTFAAGATIAFQNGSQLKEGTNGGIALECAIAYDFQWKEGVAYYRPTGGNIVSAMSAVNQVPDTGFDSTLFYAVGSRFVNLVTNVQYICTDASVGAAAWSVVASGGGNVTGPGPTVVSNNFAVYSGTGGLTIGSPTGASMDGSGNATFLSVRVNGTGGAGHMHFRHQSSAVSGTANSNTIYGLAAASNGFGFIINNDAYASSIVFDATVARTYTLPDLSGTFALLANAAAFTSLTVGTASSLAGDVIFQNATNSTTQTFRGTNPTNSIVYLLPTTAPTAGQALVSTAPSLGISTLSWSTVSGSGVNTMGAIGSTPNANGATITGTTLNLEPASASFGGVVTTGTQTFAGAKTFSGTTTITTSGNATTSVLSLTSNTYPWIGWTSTTGTLGTPVFTTRSVGTRIVMLNALSGSAVDYAIGVNTAVTWISVSQNTGRVAFYGGETEFGFFNNTGLYLQVSGTSSLGQINITPGAAGASNYEYINFGQFSNQRAAPDMTTRSVGTRLVLFSAVGGGALADYAIGVNSGDLWIGTASTAQTISMYAGATRVAFFAGTANVALTITAGYNIAFGTTGTGGQIGTTTAQLIGFHGTAGTIQRASAAQAAVATTAATQTSPWGFTTQAQADGIVTLVNEIRTVLVNKGLMKGSA
jgi:hypothetical protein